MQRDEIMRAVTAWGEELARSGVTAADLYMVGGPSAPISSRHLLVPPSGPLRDMVPGSPRGTGHHFSLATRTVG